MTMQENPSLLSRFTERTKMPVFVWAAIALFILGLTYKVITAGHVLINLNERSLEVAKAERKVSDREKKVVEVTDTAIEHLEKLKASVPPPEREHFSAAQMTLRDEVRKPILRTFPEKEK